MTLVVTVTGCGTSRSVTDIDQSEKKNYLEMLYSDLQII